MQISPKKGVTLVEILVVIAIMVALMLLTLETFNKRGATRALDTDTQAIILELNKARSLTLASKDEMQYGVHLSSTSVTLFGGPTYIEGVATSSTTYFNRNVSISNIYLAGGGSDIVFDRLTGKTPHSGTIIVSITGKLDATKNIEVYPTGIAAIQ